MSFVVPLCFASAAIAGYVAADRQIGSVSSCLPSLALHMPCEFDFWGLFYQYRQQLQAPSSTILPSAPLAGVMPGHVLPCRLWTKSIVTEVWGDKLRNKC